MQVKVYRLLSGRWPVERLACTHVEPSFLGQGHGCITARYTRALPNIAFLLSQCWAQ